MFKTVRPLPPSNLTLLSLDPFTITWIPPFALPEVHLSYFVNVTNLNTSQVFNSGELKTPSFNFSVTVDNSPCDIYQFIVTAKNAAGWSDPSDTFNASTPSCKFIRSTRCLNSGTMQVKLQIDFLSTMMCFI